MSFTIRPVCKIGNHPIFSLNLTLTKIFTGCLLALNTSAKENHKVFLLKIENKIRKVRCI